MYLPPEHLYRVPFDGSFELSRARHGPPRGVDSKHELKETLEDLTERLEDQQRRLYAQDTWSLLLVFQAMDAAGKDGTIRAVMKGVDPAGCSVHSFKAPTKEELDHDFLWRTTRRLPERGRIGIFNRSYYEETLIVRVHPEILESQKLPGLLDREEIWASRFESIRAHERHLAQNGTVILKFFLNVSYEEQRRRFLDRISEPEKHWKFSARDVSERGHWPAYMAAYQDAIRRTARPWAPWYVIPADNKRYMRVQVADVIVSTLRGLKLHYPRVSGEDLTALKVAGEGLRVEEG